MFFDWAAVTGRTALHDTQAESHLGEISGSYGGEYEDDSLLGCCAV
jgi:hypothetical protein